MIIPSTPFCPRYGGNPAFNGRDYGFAINQFMERLREDDWGIIVDHDCIWTHRFWFWRIEEAVEKYPTAGFFTTMRYPAFTKWAIPKRLEGTKNESLGYHKMIGSKIARDHEGEVEDITEYEKLEGGTPNAGIFILSKRVWLAAGGFKQGWRQIDYNMHKKVRSLGYRCYLLKDVYLWHPKGMWYE